MKQKGSILIFTLWVLVILAILSIALSRRASSDVRLARRESFNIKAMYLARAGIMKMLVEITRDTNSYDSLNEDWNRDRDNPKELILRNDKVFYGASDESSRLNLNSSALEDIHLVRLGMDGSIAKNILEYKDTKAAEGFEFMEELFLVEGMTQDAYALIKDYVTIYRDPGHEVNINTAGETVLNAVLGDWGLVQDILEYRRGPDGEEASEDDGVFKDPGDINAISGLDPALFTVKSNVFRIWAQSSFSEDKDVDRGAEAVIERTGKIYHWKEY